MLSTILLRKFIRSFSTAALVCGILLSCTGGGGGSSDLSSDSGSISGVLSAGRVNGATINAYALKNDGTQGALLGTATTDTTGAFNLDLSSISKPLIVIATGGSYIEEAGGATIDLGNSQIRAVLPSVANGESIGITVVTEIAAQAALANIATNSSVAMSSVIASTNQKAGAAMGITDITEAPADTLSPASEASTPASAQYALVLASISQIASNASTTHSTDINSLDIMQALQLAFTYNGNFTATAPAAGGGTQNIPVPNGAGVALNLATVLGGANDFGAALNSARNDYLATADAISRGYNNPTLAPPPAFVTVPTAAANSPVLTLPSAPTTLPSSRPAIAGPPPILGPLANGRYVMTDLVCTTGGVPTAINDIVYTLTVTGATSSMKVEFDSGCAKTVEQTLTVSGSGVEVVDTKVSCSNSCVSASECSAGSLSRESWSIVPSGNAFEATADSATATEAGCAGSLAMNLYFTPINSTVPGAPVIGTATAGNTSANVAFTAPSETGGMPITGYIVTSTPEGITATGTSSPITITGLTNGTEYTFNVKATSLVGTGTASAESNAVTPIAPATVPDAPTIGVATPGNANAQVAFTAPASNGGAAITSYTVTSTPGNKTATGASSPLTVTGLTNGVAYTFKVTATNSVGTSATSAASNSVTPRTVPGAPTIGAVTPGNTTVSVAFTAPASNGGSAITSYTVTSTPGGITATGASSPISVSGLTNGTAYTFKVAATNAAGTGSQSAASASATPRTVPDAPTIGVASAGNMRATINFTAPASNGGASITSYTVTSSPGGLTASGSASPIDVTGLTNNVAYTFTVTATNAAGTSASSSASNSVTPVTATASYDPATAGGSCLMTIGATTICRDYVGYTLAQVQAGCSSGAPTAQSCLVRFPGTYVGGCQNISGPPPHAITMSTTDTSASCSTVWRFP